MAKKKPIKLDAALFQLRQELNTFDLVYTHVVYIFDGETWHFKGKRVDGKRAIKLATQSAKRQSAVYWCVLRVQTESLPYRWGPLPVPVPVVVS